MKINKTQKVIVTKAVKKEAVNVHTPKVNKD